MWTLTESRWWKMDGGDLLGGIFVVDSKIWQLAANIKKRQCLQVWSSCHRHGEKIPKIKQKYSIGKFSMLCCGDWCNHTMRKDDGFLWQNEWKWSSISLLYLHHHMFLSKLFKLIFKSIALLLVPHFLGFSIKTLKRSSNVFCCWCSFRSLYVSSLLYVSDSVTVRSHISWRWERHIPCKRVEIFL